MRDGEDPATGSKLSEYRMDEAKLRARLHLGPDDDLGLAIYHSIDAIPACVICGGRAYWRGMNSDRTATIAEVEQGQARIEVYHDRRIHTERAEQFEKRAAKQIARDGLRPARHIAEED